MNTDTKKAMVSLLMRDVVTLITQHETKLLNEPETRLLDEAVQNNTPVKIGHFELMTAGSISQEEGRQLGLAEQYPWYGEAGDRSS